MRHFTTEENNRLILMKEYVDDVQSYPGLSNEDLCAKMRLIEHFAKTFQKDHGPVPKTEGTDGTSHSG